MNPFKNISVMRDQEDQVKEPTKFPEKREYDPAYQLLQQENDRLQHLTTVLIDHIWKKQPFPLKEIDQQMALFDKEQMDERSQQRSQFDDGGVDGIQRNK